MIEYKTQGVCAKKITFTIDNNIVKNVSFTEGCNGNLQGISKLVEGMNADEVIKRLEGIKCGNKNTSCPAQLAKALREELEKSQGKN